MAQEPNEILPSLHPGCWETSEGHEVSALLARWSQLLRSSSGIQHVLGDGANSEAAYNHFLCACATEPKGTVDCAEL